MIFFSATLSKFNEDTYRKLIDAEELEIVEFPTLRYLSTGENVPQNIEVITA